MREADDQQGGLFSDLSVESRCFDRVYAEGGRSSVPPERLVRALMLQVLYSILSERLIEARVARKLLRRVVRQARRSRLLSNENFTMDGTLIESWAAAKIIRRRGGRDEPPGLGRNAAVDLHGERRSNKTHMALHDPEAKLHRKAQSAPAKLHWLGHVLMKHRTGLPVDVVMTEANGFAEREAVIAMLDRLPKPVRRTLAADKAYQTADFVAALHERNLTPHVAVNDNRQYRHDLHLARPPALMHHAVEAPARELAKDLTVSQPPDVPVDLLVEP